MNPRARRLLEFSATAGLALALSSCAPNAPTPQGSSVNTLYNSFTIVAAVVFVVVVGLIFWSIIRYRARDDDPDIVPRQTKKNVPLEITYFAIPQLIVAGMFVASVFVLTDVNAEPTTVSSQQPVEITVTGFQWGWDFTYPGDKTVESLPHDVATFYLPTDTPIRFNLRSRDVIHSFFIPQFMMKRDAIPGVHNSFQISGIDTPGTYRIQCAEFCGLLHDRMYAYVKAVPPTQYQAWLAKQPRGG